MECCSIGIPCLVSININRVEINAKILWYSLLQKAKLRAREAVNMTVKHKLDYFWVDPDGFYLGE